MKIPLPFTRAFQRAVALSLSIFCVSAAQAQIVDNSDLIAAVQPNPVLVATLPEALQKATTLKIGTAISPPGTFYLEDGSTVVGLDVDLMRAILAKLDLKAEFAPMEFGAMITTLLSGRIDLVIGQMNDTVERQKQVDFIDYMMTGISITVQKGNPQAIQGVDDFCGKNIGTVAGTTQNALVQKIAERCLAEGKPAIEMTTTDSTVQNLVQLRTGRIHATIDDLPSSVYNAATVDGGNALEVVSAELINGGPLGIAIAKENGALRDGVAQALAELLQDGTYAKILASWGIGDYALIAQVSINGA